MATTERDLLHRIAVLEAENAALRNSLKGAAQPGAETGDLDVPQGRLAEEYEDLSKAYRDLHEKHRRCRSYVERATEKYRAAKESAKQWQKFYDHQQRKAAWVSEANDHVTRASSPGLCVSDLERTPRPSCVTSGPCGECQSREELRGPDDIAEVAFLLPITATHGNRGEVGQPQPPDAEHDKHSNLSSDTAGCRDARVTSSQTTEAGSDPPVATNHTLPCSEDEPQFVSARPVKRRRGNSPRGIKASTRIKEEPASPSKPFEINSVDFSSPATKVRQPICTETSNLDVIVSKSYSSKHQRAQQATPAEVVRPARILTMTSSLSDGDVADNQQQEVKAESKSTMQSAALRCEGSDLSDRALQPLSANVARSARYRSSPSEMKRKRRNEDSEAKANIVSEDGDMDSSQVHLEERKDTPTNAAANARLDSLLDEPNPGRHKIHRRPNLDASALRRREHFATPEKLSRTTEKTSTREKSLSKTTPPSKMLHIPAKFSVSAASEGRPWTIEKSPPPPDPEDEPLRARPVVQLRLEDFKINLGYKGTDFAFADTLRGRDQRRCLPGCTRPECCGEAFRKAAEMGNHTEQTDGKALEAYLGPNFASYMSSRPRSERDDILIKARTHAIASEHGKHRQAFKRRTTPPGFWRVDMPSTQEEAQDRAKATEMVRQEVYDRWREAVTSGGRWKFRDE